MELPLSGRLDKRPWSGDYWPTYKGGITNRWTLENTLFGKSMKYDLLKKEDLSKFDISTLSPSEKYDLYVGDYDWTLTKLERERTGILTKRNIPKWEGLCHAWAPATIIYDAPGMITLKNPDGISIPFYASDIKALLVFNIHLLGEATNTYFMGSRCDIKFPIFLQSLSLGIINEERFFKMTRKEECNDMDAGATHLALANLVGLRKTSLVMDKTRGSEVWNQAIYGYQSKILKTAVPKKSQKNENPLLEVAKILTLETNITYIKEIPPNKSGENFPKSSLADYKYKYEIFLNKNGTIIGGNWISKDRPDFFWRIDDPGFHPAFLPLKEIYLASVPFSKNEKRTLSKNQLKGLFKSSAKKIINAQRFTRSSAAIAVEREVRKKDYYNKLKYSILNKYKAFKELVGAP